MAGTKVKYYCPHCRTQVSGRPVNDYCTIWFKNYGGPMEKCPKCGEIYRRSSVLEAARYLTMAKRVPFLMTNELTMILYPLAVLFSMTVMVREENYRAVRNFLQRSGIYRGYVDEGGLFMLLLLAIIAVYLIVCAATYVHRQEHKNRVLAESRGRMKDIQYFIRTMESGPFATVRPEEIAGKYAEAMKQMEADQPVRRQG